MKAANFSGASRARPVVVVLTEHDFDPEPDAARQELTCRRYAYCIEDLAVHDETVIFLHTAFGADLIRSSLLNEFGKGLKLRFLSERSYHGPGGLLRLLPEGFDGHIVLVCVADFRRELDVRRLVKKHIDSEGKLSIVTAMPANERAQQEFVIEGGGAVTEVREVTGPSQRISVGVYVISSDLVDLVPSGVHVSMTDLFLATRRGGHKVSAIEFEGAIGLLSS